MALSRDPEILKIPAFRRKRSLASRQRRPLVLTALDRKKAGILPEGISNKKKKKIAKKTQPINYSFPFDVVPAPRKDAKKITAKKSNKMPEKKINFVEPVIETFTEPFVDFSDSKIPSKKTQKIGTVTHYYEKIKVGVIKLSKILCVGDSIKYETADGTCEQLVQSMEIDRQPVFRAAKGKEIGIKLKKQPKLGSRVLMA